MTERTWLQIGDKKKIANHIYEVYDYYPSKNDAIKTSQNMKVGGYFTRVIRANTGHGMRYVVLSRWSTTTCPKETHIRNVLGRRKV